MRPSGGAGTTRGPAAASARSNSISVGASCGLHTMLDSERRRGSISVKRSRASSRKNEPGWGLPSSSLKRELRNSVRSAREAAT